MKGGHLDKCCELCWAQGNFLANLGPPELLKYFSEASESRVIPTESKGEASPLPTLEQLCWVQRALGGSTWTRAAPFQRFPPSLPWAPVRFPWSGLAGDWPGWMLRVRVWGGWGLSAGGTRTSG